MSTHAHPWLARDLRSQLNRDHQRLNQLFDQVMAAFRNGDHEEAAALWTQFDTGLRNHIDFEELHLVPQFRKLYPRAAGQLLAEHAQMLALVGKLSVGVDLHLTRSDITDELIARLRAHADREDRLLYRWMHVSGSSVEEYPQLAAAGANAGPRRGR